jgi:hypothetical protein
VSEVYDQDQDKEPVEKKRVLKRRPTIEQDRKRIYGDAGTFDVTVRIPYGFRSPEEAAGFIQAAISEEMRRQKWIGEPVVLWREDIPGGKICIFEPRRGISLADIESLPHDLIEKSDET